MRLALPLGVMLVTASLGLGTACQSGYDLLDGPDGGWAGSPSDSGTGGSTPSGGGTDTGGTDTGGTGGSGGAGGSSGGQTGGSDAGGTSGGAGGSSGGAGGSSGGAGGSSGGAGGSSGGSGGSSGGSGGGSGGTTEVLTVSTASDEADANATPSSPGGTGFSLREAILYANQTAGHHQIVFDSQYTINLTQPLPTITETAHVLGTAGAGSVTLNGAGAGPSSPCVSVLASDVVLESLWIVGCPTEPVSFRAGSGSGNVMTECYVSSSGPATFYGQGPVVLFNYWDHPGGMAIGVYAADAQILANQIVNPAAAGIYVDNDSSDVLLLANLVIAASPGVDLRGFDGARVWHNTIVDSSGDGVRLQGTTNVDFRNNIVSGANRYGVDGSSVQFSFFDHNLYFANGSGHCSSCALGANDLTADPLFLNPASDDYSLSSGSPAVDSGIDLGEDRNLDAPGLYNGTAPDRGFIETD